MHTWIKQNGKWCISSGKHISQEVKQPYVKWLLMYSVPRSENLRSCPSLFLYLKWGSKLHVYASGASPPLGVAFLFPPLTIKITLGDFPQIEAHFLVQTWFRTRWYEAYFSAKLRAALCESTDLVFYSSPTGQLAVFISWHHPDGVSVLCWGTRLNSTIVYHPVF